MFDRSNRHLVRFTINDVSDIIAYFEHMRQAENETMPSGRRKRDIATELAEGIFIPTAGEGDELLFSENGKDRILSFDHIYYRQPLSEKGISWDALNQISHDTFGSAYHT